MLHARTRRTRSSGPGVGSSMSVTTKWCWSSRTAARMSELLEESAEERLEQDHVVGVGGGLLQPEGDAAEARADRDDGEAQRRQRLVPGQRRKVVAGEPLVGGHRPVAPQQVRQPREAVLLGHPL